MPTVVGGIITCLGGVLLIVTPTNGADEDGADVVGPIVVGNVFVLEQLI